MRNIPQYPSYSVSECGTIVINNRNNKKAKLTNNKGYIYCTLNTLDQGKYYTFIAVHRLVAFTYLDSPKEEQIWVNHIDGNKGNNHYSNLEWSTIAENIQHAHRTGLIVPQRGEDSHMYGKKASRETKKKMSAKKLGKNHPKFKGFYMVHHLKYYSSYEAERKTGENYATIRRKCMKGLQGSEYYFVPVDKNQI